MLYNVVLQVMAAANLGGRLVWAALSDVIGRRTVYIIFTMAAAPLFAVMPTLAAAAAAAGETNAGAAGLAAFCGAAAGGVAIMGGNLSTLAAYEGT